MTDAVLPVCYKTFLSLDTHAQIRFFDKILVGDDCWEWQAGLDKDGYGQFGIGNRKLKPHRVSYELFVGPIPDGLQIDHLCRNRKCVRPNHLEPVTQRENLLRGESANAKKTRCPQGHVYDAENTKILQGGRRRCRTCDRENSRRRYELRKTAALGG